jgi:Sugar-transfer associated ATP-grasp
MANAPPALLHPDTRRPIVGTLIPQWAALARLVISAAESLPDIRTQSWDIALAAEGLVLLEVNYGGDLNLAQLAHGTGVLDERYTEHLAAAATQQSVPELRCVEAYYLQRTRFERVAERKLRRRQVTEDGHVEITGRDLREGSRMPKGRCSLYVRG